MFQVGTTQTIYLWTIFTHFLQIQRFQHFGLFILKFKMSIVLQIYIGLKSFKFCYFVKLKMIMSK